MLKVPYRKLRPNSKGGLNNKHNDYSKVSLCNTYQHKLQYVGKRIVQGIPVLSIFALLGVGYYLCTLPLVQRNQANAMDTSSESTTQSDTEEDITKNSQQKENEETRQTTEDFDETNSDIDEAIQPNDIDSGNDYTPTAYALVDNATASLTISGANANEQIVAGFGETAYRSHNVRVQADNIASYILTISSISSTLNQPASDITVKGANNTTGANMLDDTWGYGWGDVTENESNLTYTAPNAVGTNLNAGLVVDHKIDQTKKLTFAIKFSDDATPGRYYGNVNLSLVATPKEIAGIEPGMKLQDITEEICAATPIGDTQYILQDSRDGNSYTVARLKDGNCWMTQSLRIVGRTLTSNDSAVTRNYTLPSSSMTSFNTSNTTQAAYYPGDTSIGAYYTWCAATAGCTTDQSVCPKNWALPTSTQFTSFLNTMGTSTTTLKAMPYNFTTPGRIYNGGYQYQGGIGYYWSQTAAASDKGYYLGIDATTGVSSVTTGQKRCGDSVRCFIGVSQ